MKTTNLTIPIRTDSPASFAESMAMTGVVMLFVAIVVKAFN